MTVESGLSLWQRLVTRRWAAVVRRVEVSMRILIAEDQLTSALFLRRTLERLGHEVIVATDGTEAWRMVQDDAVSVVISDWMMPGMDGLELCRRIRIRAGLRYTYIILLTSKDRRSGASRGTAPVPTTSWSSLSTRMSWPCGCRSRSGFWECRNELERLNVRLGRDGHDRRLDRRAKPPLLRRGPPDLLLVRNRRASPLSLVMVDVDQFKSFNDTFGHPAGDSVLRTVADLLRSNVRDHDVVARYGGEEFVVLLPATDIVGSQAVAERLCTPSPSSPGHCGP